MNVDPEIIAKHGTEHSHQSALFAWAALNRSKYPELEWMFAIKNVEKGGKVFGAIAKAEGVKKGVSDILLPVARHNCHGLFIEMKKPGEKARVDQLAFGKQMQSNGYGFCVCDSWEKAKDVLIQYLS